MITQTFYMQDYDWSVKVFYNPTSQDLCSIVHSLKRVGWESVSPETIEFLVGSKNTGLTYSNRVDRSSVLVLGGGDCPAEFINTLFHECAHLMSHICEYYELSPYGETVQYLLGNIGTQLFPVAKQFICEHCRAKVI